ncbi:MAG: aminopeptidase P family N-terminal domain-containing protein [Devosia sp.]
MPVELIEARLPDFGVPATRPELPRSLYAQRLAALGRARRNAGLDAVLIYADREHSANLSWLTGIDPRFEEMLLVLATGREPTLLAGPENLGRAQHATIDLEARLYPPFGLLGQNRAETPALEEVLASAGVAPGQRVGVLGWKYFGLDEAPKPESWFETPSFIIDTLRRLVGQDGRVVNANALLMHASTGLRAVNEVEQIAQFEFGAVMASEALKALFANVRPGMSEFAAVQSMDLGVLPHTCHTMLSTGARLSGLESPSGKIIERGDPLTTAVGYPGGLSSRVAWVVADKSELPAAASDWLERLAMPYFACAAEWYETIGIGVAGGSLDALARRHLGAPFFNLILNPGHLTHLDEWMNTPVYPGSSELLKSGQAIQCDIIPAVGAPYHSANIEDGLALLDGNGRAELADKFPEIAARVAMRRAFMADTLGIHLKPEAMPLSNLAAAYPPFLLSPNRLLAMR